MFRNACVLALLVLCGTTARADPIEIMKQVAGHVASQAMAAVKNCVTTYKIEELLGNPTPENAAKAVSCMAACGSTAVGMMSPEGKMQGDTMMALLPEGTPFKKEFTEMLKDCGSKAGSDPCDTAMKFFKCMIHEKAFGSIIKTAKSFLIKFATSMIL